MMNLKESLPKVGKINERKDMKKRDTGIGICREAETGIEIKKRKGRETVTGVMTGITEIGIDITVREGSEAGIEMMMMVIFEDGTMKGEILIFFVNAYVKLGDWEVLINVLVFQN